MRLWKLLAVNKTRQTIQDDLNTPLECKSSVDIEDKSSPLRAAGRDAAHLHVHVGFIQGSEVKAAVELIHIWTQNTTTEQTAHEPLSSDGQKSSQNVQSIGLTGIQRHGFIAS